MGLAVSVPRVEGDGLIETYKRTALAELDFLPVRGYSTVTDFARFRGWSTSVPFSTATW